MPINKEKSYQLGFSAPNELVETIDDLCSRIGVSKSQFIRKACREMVWKLLHEQKRVQKVEELEIKELLQEVSST